MNRELRKGMTRACDADHPTGHTWRGPLRRESGAWFDVCIYCDRTRPSEAPEERRA